jgi:nicotinamide-nucleotide amidase
MTSESEEERLLSALSAKLKRRHTSFAAAESCTGGLIAAAATSIAGSSSWFERGYVTYSNAAKSEALGVDPELIERFGAVSEVCAMAMAEGCLNHSRAGFALSVTGIAGPDGGSADKPVGTVCFGWSGRDLVTHVDTALFGGDRAAVRRQSVLHALKGMLNYLNAAAT